MGPEAQAFGNWILRSLHAWVPRGLGAGGGWENRPRGTSSNPSSH